MTLQPVLENDIIKIRPLTDDDFESLYSIASDPLLWEQHPNKDRYKKEVFTTFFEGAIKSGGAFVVYNVKTNEAIGSSRYYDLNEQSSSVCIGYTFIARDHWGKGANPALKKLMINFAFEHVNNILFHIGAVNIRSQKALKRIGVTKIDEMVMEYYGEAPKLNFIYQLKKEDWLKNANRRNISLSTSKPKLKS
ncbi:GNAT family protein [soil metagenome]